MKEAIGGSWLFVFVIVFLSIFAGFISLSVNYSRCYHTKDQIVKIIEKNKGVTNDTITKINAALNNSSYRGFGKCPSDGRCWYSFDVTKNKFQSGYSQTTNYCISRTALTKVDVTDEEYRSNGIMGHMDSAYYSVVVFFRLDIPVLFSDFQITLEGETSPIHTTKDADEIRNDDGSKCVVN